MPHHLAQPGFARRVIWRSASYCRRLLRRRSRGLRQTKPKRDATVERIRKRSAAPQRGAGSLKSENRMCNSGNHSSNIIIRITRSRSSALCAWVMEGDNSVSFVSCDSDCGGLVGPRGILQSPSNWAPSVTTRVLFSKSTTGLAGTSQCYGHRLASVWKSMPTAVSTPMRATW
jgi:hypothetical protein